MPNKDEREAIFCKKLIQRFGGVSLSILMIGSLMALAIALLSVSSVCAFSHVNNITSLSDQTVLSDDFRLDTSLNSDIWQVNGPVGTLVGIHISDVPNTIVTPTITFSTTYGMGISGVNRNYQAATIQSVHSFSPPFTVTANVMGTLAYAVAFLLGISTPTGNHGVVIDANLAPSSGYLGIWYQTATGINEGWTYYQQGPLVSNPSVNVMYQVSISVDSSGTATLGVRSQGNLLGTASTQVGTGEFYIILGQREGYPIVSGPNQAYWESVSVSTLSTPVVPEPRSQSTPVVTEPGISDNPSGPPRYFFVAIVALVIGAGLLVIASKKDRRNTHGHGFRFNKDTGVLEED